MATRAGVAYIIEEVRRLAGAGTADLSIAGVDYFTDEHIQEILDSRRVRLSREQMWYEHELSEGGGTTIYHNMRLGHGWVEDVQAGGNTDNMKITDSQGSIQGTSLYTFNAVEGFIRFTSNQKGSYRYYTGWGYNPYTAAYDLLLSWSMSLARQPDWTTDNMGVKRSQKVKALREQMKDLKMLAGLAPPIKVHQMERSDVYREEIVKPPYKHTKIPT